MADGSVSEGLVSEGLVSEGPVSESPASESPASQGQLSDDPVSDDPASDDPGPGAEGLDLARALARSVAATARRPSLPGGRAGVAGGRRTLPTSRSALSRSSPVSPSMSGAHPDDRDPQPLGSTLGRLVDDHGWELDLRVHGLFGRWAELVGQDVALHCTPETFADGRLVVRTDSTAWATELRLLAPTVVRRLNTELGHGVVTLIEVLGPVGPSWKKGRRSVRGGRGPRDTYG